MTTTQDASPFQPDNLTERSVTNARGIEIKLGDIVVVKGSKIERVVKGIHLDRRGESLMVRGTRKDLGKAAYADYLNPDRLTVIGSVLA